jgi:hypothetical protein
MRRVVLLVLLAGVVAGCGGSKHTSTQAAPPTTTVAPAPATTATRSTTTTATRPPASAATGFQPVSFTAVSENDYWVLGTVPCHGGQCSSILATTDGGASFERVPAPALANTGPPGALPVLRFADRQDGWAFVTGLHGVFFSTHDGGATWHRLALGDLLAFASGGGYAYAVTARCTLQRCTGYQVERTPVSSDSWSGAGLPFEPDGPIVDLSAHGTNVWLLGTSAGQEQSQYDELARSKDGGQTFVTGPGPCIPGLGGQLSPTSPSVLWAVCPTGMLAGAWRSTDGGLTFAAVKGPPLVNSAVLAPASASTAMLARNGAGKPLLRTTDAGARWTPAHTPATPDDCLWIGFTDADVGAAIVQIHRKQELWRTTNGGADWSAVSLGA